MNEIIRLRREGETIVFSTGGGIGVRVSLDDAIFLRDALIDRVRCAEKERKQRIASERKAKRAALGTSGGGA